MVHAQTVNDASSVVWDLQSTIQASNGISNDMSSTFLQRVKWSCLIVVGIIGPVLRG